MPAANVLMGIGIINNFSIIRLRKNAIIFPRKLKPYNNVSFLRFKNVCYISLLVANQSKTKYVF